MTPQELDRAKRDAMDMLASRCGIYVRNWEEAVAVSKLLGRDSRLFLAISGLLFVAVAVLILADIYRSSP